jgi:cobalt/nickel transport system permease protein
VLATYAPLMVAEAAVTGFTLAFLLKVAPELITLQE